MKQVIDETLRLYPPVPEDNRCTVEDDVLPGSGYSKSSRVSTSPLLIINRNSQKYNRGLSSLGNS